MEHPLAKGEFSLFDCSRLLTLLHDSIHYKIFEPRDTIFHEGDLVHSSIYVVCSGRIRIERHTNEGRIAVLGVLRQEEIFGESSLICDRYDHSSICEQAAKVAIIPQQALIDELSINCELCLELLGQFLLQLAILRNRVELNHLRSAKEKFVRYLNLFSCSASTTVVLDRSYKDIAEEIGLTPEAFYRTLSDLENKGFISRTNNEIELSARIVESFY